MTCLCTFCDCPVSTIISNFLQRQALLAVWCQSRGLIPDRAWSCRFTRLQSSISEANRIAKFEMTAAAHGPSAASTMIVCQTALPVPHQHPMGLCEQLLLEPPYPWMVRNNVALCPTSHWLPMTSSYSSHAMASWFPEVTAGLDNRYIYTLHDT